jgi:hypothetical protein
MTKILKITYFLTSSPPVPCFLFDHMLHFFYCHSNLLQFSMCVCLCVCLCVCVCVCVERECKCVETKYISVYFFYFCLYPAAISFYLQLEGWCKGGAMLICVFGKDLHCLFCFCHFIRLCRIRVVSLCSTWLNVFWCHNDVTAPLQYGWYRIRCVEVMRLLQKSLWKWSWMRIMFGLCVCMC